MAHEAIFLVGLSLAENDVMEVRCVGSLQRTTSSRLKVTTTQRDIHGHRAYEKDGKNEDGENVCNHDVPLPFFECFRFFCFLRSQTYSVCNDQMGRDGVPKRGE